MSSLILLEIKIFLRDILTQISHSHLPFLIDNSQELDVQLNSWMVLIEDKLVTLIKMAYSKDDYWKDIYKWFSSDSNYQKIDDLLFTKEVQPRLCLTQDESILKEILVMNHDIPRAGHLDIHKTYKRIHKWYYWPRMFHTITKYVQSYDSCQWLKNVRTPPVGLLLPLEPPIGR